MVSVDSNGPGASLAGRSLTWTRSIVPWPASTREHAGSARSADSRSAQRGSRPHRPRPGASGARRPVGRREDRRPLRPAERERGRGGESAARGNLPDRELRVRAHRDRRSRRTAGSRDHPLSDPSPMMAWRGALGLAPGPRHRARIRDEPPRHRHWRQRDDAAGGESRGRVVASGVHVEALGTPHAVARVNELLARGTDRWAVTLHLTC